MKTYHITLRDRETQTVVGYFNGSWTTDRCRAVTTNKRDAAEDHAARMRDQCPRNADVIKVGGDRRRRLAFRFNRGAGGDE
jgi:hypothetical protein